MDKAAMEEDLLSMQVGMATAGFQQPQLTLQSIRRTTRMLRLF